MGAGAAELDGELELAGVCFWQAASSTSAQIAMAEALVRITVSAKVG